MPRVKRRGHLERELTEGETFDLLLGGRAFENDQQRRQAWTRHREHLMATCNPGMRPEAWWTFEAREPRERGNEWAQLARLGVLTEAEREFRALNSHRSSAPLQIESTEDEE